MSTARVTSPPAPTASAKAAVKRPLLVLIGPPGVGKRALQERSGSDAIFFRLESHEDLSATPTGDSYFFAIDGSGSPADEETALTAVAVGMTALRDRLGQECAIGGLPVFVVLTKADLLARPGDNHAAWLDRIEERKQQLSDKLGAQLLLLKAQDGAGFGALSLHAWATAVRRPPLADRRDVDEPFGVQELFQHAAKLARGYAGHRVLQRRRTRALLGVLLVVLTGLLVLIGMWGWSKAPPFRRSATPAPHIARSEAEQFAESARRLTREARALMSLARHTSAAGEVDWDAWVFDARELAQQVLHLVHDTGVRNEAELRELLHASEQLGGLRERVRVLVSGRDGAGALRFPKSDGSLPGTEWAANANLESLRGLRERTLPAEMPRGVANHLHAVAWAARERFLEPVRAEIRRRVVEGGKGKETPEGWRQLRDGWLTKEAPAQLADWRIVVMALEKLAGAEAPTDPLIELESFLRHDSLVLPIGQARLTLPKKLFEVDWIKDRVDVLTLTHRKAEGQESTYRLRFTLARPEFSRDDPGVYRLDDGKAGGERLIFRPGDELHARLVLPPVEGKTSVLVWSPVDSRSSVYAFDALNHPPRLQAETETDPVRGEIARGVSLRFAQPAAWKLPDLLWK